MSTSIFVIITFLINMEVITTQMTIKFPTRPHGLNLMDIDGKTFDRNLETGEIYPVFDLTFDPSSFSPAVHACHVTCADNYSKCMLESCDQTSHSKSRIANSQSEKRAPTGSQSWKSKLLQILTLGFAGGRKRETGLRVMEQTQQTGYINEQKCIVNCRLTFHVCYKQCVCMEKQDAKKCKAFVTASKNGQVIQTDNQSMGTTEYKFEWNRMA